MTIVEPTTASLRPGAVVGRSTTYDSFEVTTLTPHLGAQIDRLDLSQPLDDAQLAELRRAWADWGVLVFRDQQLDRQAHKSFGRYFGELHVHPMNYSGERVSIIGTERPLGVASAGA